MGDRIAVIDHGKLRQVGTPSEIYDDPADDFVATFLGTPPMNLVERNGGDLWAFGRRISCPGRCSTTAALTELPFRIDRIGVSRIGAHLVRRVGWLPAKREVTAKLPAHVAAVGIRAGEWHAFAVRKASCAISTRTASGSSPLKERADGRRSPSQSPRQWRARDFVSIGCEVLGPLFIAPAILYVVLLVGLPFLLALYYSVSAYSIYNPSYSLSAWRTSARSSKARSSGGRWSTPSSSRSARKSSACLLGKIGAMLLMQDFPGRGIARALIVLPWAVPVSLATLAWQWMFDSLYSVINWTLVAAGIDRCAQTGHNGWGKQDLAMLAVIIVHAWRLVSVRRRDLPCRHHRRCRRTCSMPPRSTVRASGGATIRSSCQSSRRSSDRCDLRHRVHLHRSQHRLSADQGRPDQRHAGAGLAGFQVGILSGDVAHGAAICLFLLPFLLVAVIFLLRFLRRREI